MFRAIQLKKTLSLLWYRSDMSYKKIVVLCLFIILIALLFVFFTRPSVVSLPQSTQATATSTPTLEVTEKAITASTTQYSVDAKYPQFGIPSIDVKISKW